MALLRRHAPDAIAREGVRVHRLGEPFRVTEIPGKPGILWQGCVFPDGRLRPVPIDELRIIRSAEVEVAEVDPGRVEEVRADG